MLEEHNCLILILQPVPKLRYSAHTEENKPLHCTESLKSIDIEIFCSCMTDKHKSLILTSMTHN